MLWPSVLLNIEAVIANVLMAEGLSAEQPDTKVKGTSEP